MILLACAMGLSAPAIANPERSQHPRVGLLATVTFASDSSQLKWGANRKLGRVAGWAEANPGGLIVLDAHTDPRGSEQYNRELAMQRARTVLGKLVDAGVPASRIVIAVYGERGPRRGTNRRVTMWATRSGIDAVIARIEARGTAQVMRGDQTMISTR